MRPVERHIKQVDAYIRPGRESRQIIYHGTNMAAVNRTDFVDTVRNIKKAGTRNAP